MTYFEEAKKKLEDEASKVSGNKESAMKNAVKKALLDFCGQNEEFAQAVVQGGSFADCMKAVAANVGSSISDLEAYGKAVRFYFKGATLDVKMTINLAGEVESSEQSPKPGEKKPKKAVIVDLSDYM